MGMLKIRNFPATLAFSLALAAPVAAPLGARAQSDATHMLDAVFQMFDENADGFITTSEANRFIDKTFAEMDMKHTGKISRDAWMRFSFGLADLAADQGRSDAYDRAKYKIFKRWDKSRAGALSLEDYRAGVLGDARAAMSGGERGKDGELRIDLSGFKRAAFVRQLLHSLH
jgi:Ca2+-binding EF-hand superfamily protein